MATHPAPVTRDARQSATHGGARGAAGRARPVRRAIAAACTVAVAAYLGFAGWLWVRQPTIAFDPVQRVQALTRGVPEGQEAAWPHYQRAMGWFTALQREAMQSVPQAEEFSNMLHASPGDATWPRAQALVSTHAGHLERACEVAAMPVLGFTPGLEDDSAATGDAFAQEFLVFGITLDYLPELRNLCRLLRLDALAAAEAGDGARAARDVQAMVGVAAHVSQVPILICDLVGLAILRSAADTAVQALQLNHAAFKPADFAALDVALASVDVDTTRLHLDGERVTMDDVLQRIYSDDGTGDGDALPGRFHRLRQGLDAMLGQQVAAASMPGFVECVRGPLVWARSAGRAQVRARWSAMYDQVEAESALPARDQRYAADSELGAMLADAALAQQYFPMALLAPAVSAAARASSDARMAALEARTHIALAQYRRDTGAWPATLSELVPVYMREVPADEFAAGPLAYEVNPNGPRVRSARHQPQGRAE